MHPGVEMGVELIFLYFSLAMTFAQTSSKFAELPVEAFLRKFACDRKFGIIHIEILVS